MEPSCACSSASVVESLGFLPHVRACDHVHR
jgi:hypothetical protein